MTRSVIEAVASRLLAGTNEAAFEKAAEAASALCHCRGRGPVQATLP